MTSTRLVLRSASYHWRTNLAVTLGVAAAVAVLAGALLVGDSVRGSLRDLAIGRLGRTDHVVSSGGFFREALAENLRARGAGTTAAPLIVAGGLVTHEGSGRRAAGVLVYGVDERFWRFHGLPPEEGVVVSPALASELGVNVDGGVLLVRLQKPSAIPIESLFGRKDDVGRTMRLDVAGVLPRERLGEFALRPQQSEVRAVFAPLTRVQRDLAVAGKVNTVLLAGGTGDVDAAVRAALELEDGGATVTAAGNSTAVAVDSATGILGEPLETAARQAGQSLGLRPLPVFTYLATTIRKGDRQIPYSLITATDLDALPPGGRAGSRGADTGSGPAAPVVLNEWAARELGASPGDRIDVDYFLWDPAAGLTPHTAAFTLDRIVPIAGLAADRRLAPEYPGITAASSLADWDPPFPIDLSRVRPQDEQYWKDHRTTPKAFIEYERGRELWQTRYGRATSIRFLTAPIPPDGRTPADIPAASDPALLTNLLTVRLREALTPAAMGVAVVAAREQALAASAGATDFGEYFTYFSFFLVSSALLLAILFFRLGVEQRLRQIGILRAAGFTSARIRGLLLAEALALAAIGSGLGLLGALAYGRLIVHGLGTWWIGAVGTTRLALHVSWISLAIGAGAGVLASALCVIVSLRAVARLSPRSLLSAAGIGVTTFGVGRSGRARIAAVVCALAGLAMLGAGFASRAAQTGMFFGAGAMLLVACLCLFSYWLRARDGRTISGRGTWPLWRLGFRSAAFRPARSVLCAALIASAAFIIVSVGAFRRGGEVEPGPHSGTGGYALLGRSEVPIVQTPNDAAGREALVLSPLFERTRFTRFRVRPGEDASCLNLYRPTNPTIIAPERGFIESGRFAFAGSLAGTAAERENPWRLLDRPVRDGVIPVIADATSLEYVLHAGIGDTFAIDTGAGDPLILQFVGALSDSVLQGELLMSEENFTRLFPAQQGYRWFLIDAPDARTPAEAAALAGKLERELAPFGFDAVAAAERLESFHRVENTYLSTFQALGGLGLLLGTIGLAAIMFRNVLERRRELALLRAVGYDARRVSIVIVAEAALLLGAGLAAGMACAALAIAPAWLGRGGARPGAGLVVLLLAVGVAGLVSSLIAARAALRGNVLEALKAE